jgi:hypothetical protein
LSVVLAIRVRRNQRAESRSRLISRPKPPLHR